MVCAAKRRSMGYSRLLAITVLAYSAVSAQAQCDTQPPCPPGTGRPAQPDPEAVGGGCCVVCVAGTTWGVGGTVACAANIVSCSAGSLFTASTTIDADTVCTACDAGQFKADPSTANGDACAGAWHFPHWRSRPRLVDKHHIASAPPLASSGSWCARSSAPFT